MKFRSVFCVVMLCTAIAAKAQTNKISAANAGKSWAALWQQRAAEYKALCFQAYNVAKMRVDEAVKHKSKSSKPLAVITDIDETLLDNSPEDARAAINNQEFDNKAWKLWTAQGIADTVPGAPSFFKYAAARGITVFYVSNREADEASGTLKNLKAFGLPYADTKHLLLKTSSSSKEDRRIQISKQYNIILLCGDNLSDFDALYDNHPSEAARDAATRKLINKFGSKYIVLPNLSYGDFEGAYFDFNYKLSPAQKDSVIKAKLKTD